MIELCNLKELIWNGLRETRSRNGNKMREEMSNNIYIHQCYYYDLNHFVFCVFFFFFHAIRKSMFSEGKGQAHLHKKDVIVF